MGFIVKAVKSVVKAVVGVVSKVVGGVFGFLVGGKKSTAVAKAVNTLNKSLDPEAFKKIVFGRIAAPLDVRYWEVYGPNAARFDEVIALAGHRINAALELYMESEVGIDAAGNSQGKYAGGTLTRDVRLGAPNQTAMAVGAGGQWTAASTFDGVPHMLLRWLPDEKKLPNGIPSRYTQVVEGALVYDPRRDSTVPGGAGAHRINDRTTWEYATLDGNGVPIGRNNALQTLWYLLGWTVPTKDANGNVTGEALVCGRGVDPEDINLSTFIAGANNCEIAGYYTDMVLSTEDTHTANEDKITCAGLIGRLIDPGGLWSYYANVNDTANIAVELTDADIIQGQSVSWNEYEGMADQFNQVTGKYINPSPLTLFQAFPYPMVRDANYEAALGVKRRKPQDFEQVLDGTLAQRLARLFLNQGQYQGEFGAAFNYRAVKAQAWSVVRYTSERFGFVKLFRVWRHDIDTFQGVSMLLKEIDPSIWSAGTVNPPLAPGLGTAYQANQEIPLVGLAVANVTISGQGTNTNVYDGGNVSWTEPSIAVRRTEVRYRVVGTTYWETSAAVERGTATNALIYPLVKGTHYQVQARHVSIHEVEGPWIEAPDFLSGSAGNVDYQGILTSGTTAQWPYVGDPMGTRPENNATVGAPTGTNVAGVPAQTLVGNVNTHTALLSAQGLQISDIIVDINNLEGVYGDTAAASASAGAAAASNAAAQAAKTAAETARNDSQGARDASQAARDLALGYRNTANSASALADAAKADALIYRNQASGFADNAGGAASAAAGSASAASASASTAGQQASAASASAVQADTAKSQAQSSQAQAAQSESNAAGSASSAASSQSLSATARDQARMATLRTFPVTFNEDGLYFASSLPLTYSAEAGTKVYSSSVGNFQPVIRLGSQPNAPGIIWRFRAKAKAQNVSGTMLFRVHGFNDEGQTSAPTTGDFYHDAPIVTVTADAFNWYEVLITTPTIGAWVAPIVYVGYPSQNTAVSLAAIQMTDATAEQSALGAASASAASASQASASNTTAGQQASAAQTARVAAETARDASQGYAGAASGSASLASSSASLAGQKADAASASAQQADTSRGQAQASQQAAASSETNAASSASSAASQASLSASASQQATGATLTFGRSPAAAIGQWAYNQHNTFNPVANLALAGGVSVSNNALVVTSANIHIHPVLPTPLVKGRRYQVSATIRRLIDGPQAGIYTLYSTFWDKDGNLLYGNVVQFASRLTLNVADGEQTLVGGFTADSDNLGVAYGRVMFRTPEGGSTEIRQLYLSDVQEQTAAAESASAASTSASTAAAKATEATNSASSSTTAKNQAEAARDAASGSAGAASGSASAAAASASTAGQQATAAQNSAQAAQTAKGQAEAAQSSAATSASNAAGSASTAATQASLSATASNQAMGSAVTSGRSPGASINQWFVNLFNSLGLANAAGNIGLGGDFNLLNDVLTVLGGYHLHPGAATPLIAGRRYQVTAVIRRIIEGAQNNGYCLFCTRWDANGNLLYGNTVQLATKPTLSIAEGDVTLIGGFVAAPGDAYGRVMFRFPEAGKTAISQLFLEDVQSMTAAADSASAANSSASTATAQASAAGNSAISANQSKLDAQAANGTAQAQASAAAASASSASASAASATSSANLSAQLSSGYLNKGSSFTSWSGYYPDYWTPWGDGTNTKMAGSIGKNAFRQSNVYDANETGLLTYGSIDPGLPGVGRGAFIVEADVSLVSGSLLGAGVLFRSSSGVSFYQDFYLSFYHTASNLSPDGPTGHGTGGNRYRFSKLVRFDDPSLVSSTLFLMTAFRGFAANPWAKDIIWNSVGIRYASEAEILANAAIPSLQASVSSNSAAITTLTGRSLAYWQQTVNAGAAGAFIEARAETSPGVVSSVVSIGAREIHLYNEVAGLFRKALSVAAGNVTIYGNLYANAGIYLGSGALWRLQYASKQFAVTDGVAVSYGLDLGATPQFDYKGDGLAPLAANETYKLYSDVGTTTGFIPRLRIITPGTTTPITLNADTAPGTGPTRQIDKAANADASNNSYAFTISGTYTDYAYNTGDPYL